MANEFTQFDLQSQLVEAVTDLGYTSPTPIQSAIIPVMLTGQDVIGQAQTGTGKTAAFSLPMLQNLLPGQSKPQGLVLTPTRELAIQVADSMYHYGRLLKVRVLPVYGGQAYSRQIGRLKKGVDVVVGTPGRLLDLIEKRALDLSCVSTVVLDEADEMLSMGFIADIESILKEVRTPRQTALFSATVPPAIRRLAGKYMEKPQAITIGHKQLTVDTVEQRYYVVNDRDKLAALTRLLEVEQISSALIFTRTRVSTGALAADLAVRSFPAEALHGDMSQDARIQVMNRFRDKRIKVLVATDVAARGLDVDGISHVFNYDLPDDPEVYVHRIGRTARAGKSGVAVTLVTSRERGPLRRIESCTKQAITSCSLPSAEDMYALREQQLGEKVLVWLRRGRFSREREMVTALAAEGYDPLEIAAAALKLARTEEKQRPIEEIGKTPKWQQQSNRSAGNRYGGKNRNHGRGTHESGMVRLTFPSGKGDGILPNHVVGSISRNADIPGSVIGKIRILDQETFVDVPEEYVGKVLGMNGSFRIGNKKMSVKRA